MQGERPIFIRHLLKLPNVVAYLNELRARALEGTSDQVRPWVDLLPLAQAVVVGTAEGRFRSRLSYDAARYICDRCLGAPMSTSVVRVRDEAKVAHVLGKFMERLGQAGGGVGVSLRLPPESHAASPAFSPPVQLADDDEAA